MELLAELLWGAVVFVAEVLGELILQVLFEAGARGLVSVFKREQAIHPFFSACGAVLMGALAGGLSLWIIPHLFVVSPAARIINLVVTPLACGAAMATMGMLRDKRGAPTILLDRFAHGYLFALAMAGVRFAFGH